MTHYDPHDYGHDDDRPATTVEWLAVLITLGIIVVCLLAFWPSEANAAGIPVLIVDPNGVVLLSCESPLTLNDPILGAVTCRATPTVFYSGFEA